MQEDSQLAGHFQIFQAESNFHQSLAPGKGGSADERMGGLSPRGIKKKKEYGKAGKFPHCFSLLSQASVSGAGMGEEGRGAAGPDRDCE